MLDRLTDLKRKLEGKKAINLFILPFTFIVMVFIVMMYPNWLVIPIVSILILPSILFNSVFIFSSIRTKALIAERINNFMLKVFMSVVGVIYFLNFVLAFGNFSLVDLDSRFNYIATVSMFFGHFIL